MNKLSNTVYETKITTPTSSALLGAITDGYKQLTLCTGGRYDYHNYDNYDDYHDYHDSHYALPTALPIARVSLRVEHII